MSDLSACITVARSDDTYGGNDQMEMEDDPTVLDSLTEDEQPPETPAPQHNPGSNKITLHVSN